MLRLKAAIGPQHPGEALQHQACSASSTTDNATSATTRKPRVRPAETPPDAVRLPSFNASFRSGRELPRRPARTTRPSAKKVRA